MIGFGFEAFVFAYLGLSFFSYVDTVHMEYPWSWNFILVELVICIVARFSGTVGLLYLTSICKHKRQVSFKQLLFICYAGLIRGAIAFGLVLKLDATLVPDEFNRRVIRTTALTLVITTTIIFGSCMPLVQKRLVPVQDQEKHEYDEADAGVESDENEDTAGNRDSGIEDEKKKINESNPKDNRHSEYEEFLHPNAMKSSEYQKTPEGQRQYMSKSQFIKQRRKKFNSCASCFKRFDDLIMRPLLIHNYEPELMTKKEDFLELFMKEGDLWEKLYLKEKYDPEEIEETRTQRGHSVLRHIESRARAFSNFKGLRDSKMSMKSGAHNTSNLTVGRSLMNNIDRKLSGREGRSVSTNIPRPPTHQFNKNYNDDRMGIGIVIEEKAEYELSKDGDFSQKRQTETIKGEIHTTPNEDEEEEEEDFEATQK